MRAYRAVALLLSFAGTIGACASLLGIDDFEDAVDGGGASSSGTGGGTGGTTQSGHAGGGGGGVGGGGPAPGTELWSRCFGGDLTETAIDVQTIAGDRIVIAGEFTGSFDLGGPTLTSTEPAKADVFDVYLGLLSSNGDHEWSHRLGGFQDDRLGGIAVDGSSNIYAAGWFYGSFQIPNPGGGVDTLYAAEDDAGAAEEDMYIVKFAATGDHLWERQLGDGDGNQQARGIGTGSADGGYVTAVTGRWASVVDFGQGPWTAGNIDAFAVQYSDGNDHQWTRSIGGSAIDHGTAITVDDDGSVIAVGYYAYGLGIDGHTAVGEYDVYVVKLDSTGQVQWSRSFGDANAEAPHAVAIDGNEIVMVGEFESHIDFGGDELAAVGSLDAFVVKLDRDGNHLWSRSFGDTDDDIAWDVAIDEPGNVFVTGVVQGTVDFGSGHQHQTQDADAFVLKLDRDGNTVWSKLIGAPEHQDGRGIAIDASGAVVVHGNMRGSVQFDDQLCVATAGSQDLFVLKLTP